MYEALFARFLIIGQQRNIQLRSVFQYKLSPVQHSLVDEFGYMLGGGSRVVVGTAAFHARVRGSKSIKVQLSLSSLLNRHMKDVKEHARQRRAGEGGAIYQLTLLDFSMP